MSFESLAAAIGQHTGTFLCEERDCDTNTKVVEFHHKVTAPAGADSVPEVGDLREFYATFGSVRFYYDPHSRDSARYLAPVAVWAELHGRFSDWIDALSARERAEIVPGWIDTALVIGQTPHSGNYILVPTEGDIAGHVVEFDHDGFDFTDMAPSLARYVMDLLEPDGGTLVGMASHMTFIVGDADEQWWIRELRDNRGRVVSTEA